ncbi:conserved hypothetical protein [Luteimonas sp. 9C]|uniref:hypothetical protein n=1 Tax=Luteimonas sp. 9C TaxID=2653148 RepID=UPI0012F07A74|nr:hypothetical protein [Luteimonas sp. 9C]VXC03078.1 conserved hypothetical protein [Luteimonas sp. 9C]
MFVPKWLLAVGCGVFVAFAVWTWLLANGRNPLPFPDRGSRIFAAASPEAKAAIVDVLARNGLQERIRVDTDGVLRSILFDGTIVNWSAPGVTRRLQGATSAIGLVADDPLASAEEAAGVLRSHGFRADVVQHVEPDMPVVFLLTDAMPGTALNFRRHVIHMPRPGAASTR